MRVPEGVGVYMVPITEPEMEILKDAATTLWALQGLAGCLGLEAEALKAQTEVVSQFDRRGGWSGYPMMMRVEAPKPEEAPEA